MSAIKTVLITTAVLALGSMLFAGAYFVRQQQEDIAVLSFRVQVLEQQTSDIQKRTSINEKKLGDTIRTSNKNFRTVKQNEDDLNEVVKLIVQLLKQAADPSSYSKQRNGL